MFDSRKHSHTLKIQTVAAPNELQPAFMELLKKGETCVNGRNNQQFCLCRDHAYSARVNLQNAFGGVFARSEQEDA